MKRKITGLCVAAFVAAAFWGMPVSAMSDALVSASPKVAPSGTEGLLTIAPVMTDTADAVQEYASAWANSGHPDEYAKRFAFHLNARAKFYERAHNWNAHNDDARHYNYETLPGYTEDRGFTNSYGAETLYLLADDLEFIAAGDAFERTDDAEYDASRMALDLLLAADMHQNLISNNELRFYLNETIRFAAKQAVKDLQGEKTADSRRVDLRRAIQR